jgi:hypothetical protein
MGTSEQLVYLMVQMLLEIQDWFPKLKDALLSGLCRSVLHGENGGAEWCFSYLNVSEIVVCAKQVEDAFIKSFTELWRVEVPVG